MLSVLARLHLHGEDGDVVAWEIVGFSRDTFIDNLKEAKVWEPGKGVSAVAEEISAARPELLDLHVGLEHLSEGLSRPEGTVRGSASRTVVAELKFERRLEGRLTEVVNRHLRAAIDEDVVLGLDQQLGATAPGSTDVVLLSAARPALQSELRTILQTDFQLSQMTAIDLCPRHYLPVPCPYH